MLVLTLWLTVVLALIATSLVSHLTMQTRLVSMRRHRLTAEALARAGLAKAVADLKNDLIVDHAEKMQPFDAEGDIWKRIEEGKWEQKLGQGTFSVRVEDEESKININTAGPKLLEALLVHLGYEETDAQDAAAAIVDWRDGDDVPSLTRTAAGTEREVYGILMQGGDPTRDRPKEVPLARLKNDRFNTVDELLGVFGITPAIYYGPESDEAVLAEREMAHSLQLLGKRFEIKKKRRGRGEQPVGLRDCVTVYSNGSINLNTASFDVLAAMIRAAGNSTNPEETAERIINYRRDGAEKDIDNKNAFKTVAEVDRVGGLGVGFGQLQSSASLSVISQTFRITSTGQVPRASRTIQVVVSRSLEQYVRSESFEEMDRQRQQDRRYPYSPGRTTEDKLKSKKFGPDERSVLWPAVRMLQWIEY
jgi:type II secretory pathway component PulK